MTMTKTPPPTVKLPPHDSSGTNGHAGAPGSAGGDDFVPPTRRNSVFPFLVDLGVVLGIFGVIIVGPLYSALAGWIVLAVGGVLALSALVGWVREARADYQSLAD